MFGLGMGEIVVILIVALLFLGPAKLPEAAKAIGKGIRELRRHTRDLEQTLEQDEELGSTVRELKSALRGDPASPRIAPPRPAPTAVAKATPPPIPPAESAPAEAPAEAPAAPKPDEGSGAA